MKISEIHCILLASAFQSTQSLLVNSKIDCIIIFLHDVNIGFLPTVVFKDMFLFGWLKFVNRKLLKFIKRSISGALSDHFRGVVS